MNKLKDFIDQLKTWHKIVLGATAGLVLLVGIVRVAYLPVLGAIGEYRAIVKDLRVKNADAQVLTEQLPQAELALEQAKAQYSRLQGWITRGDSMARIVEQISQQADELRLKLVVVQSAAEEEGTLTKTLAPGFILREAPLHLTLTGRYRQIGEFLGELRQAPFVAVTQSLTMRKPEAGSADLQADLELAVYLAEEMPHP